ncbi:hypothetical protein NMG60_11016966 [Bertholletia excelsa]
MWVFYLISLPLTLAMVIFTLRYFSGPQVPRYVFFTVGYAWFCSLSIIILVPADIWTTIIDSQQGGIAFFWSWSYWSTFLLTWAVVPLIQGFEDAGDFTVAERLKTSIHVNLIFYLIVGSVGVVGLILLISLNKNWSGGVLGLAMACSNTFGLVTGIFLLGFGLSEIPKSIWRNADWTTRQKVLSHKVSKMAKKLDDAHQELSNTIVVAQETSKQIPKRDPLRPYMDVIDNMIVQMFHEDPSFKPLGGQLGDNDMDYDADEKSLATLRRHIREAREDYYRYRSEYMKYVMEALELEDTIRNYESRSTTGWKFVSSLRPDQTDKLRPFIDTTELIWRCILRNKLKKLLAIVLGCMSAAILLAEATLLPSSVDFSLFSILIKFVANQEVLVQVFAFVPLVYMCVCTYYSLFKVGMLMFYSLTPRQTSSVNLLMICSMVARYAPPISYNFLNLIRLEGKKTIFEKRMGNIDDAVPFFGTGFNRIYPLIMVIYTLLVISNFFDRIIDFFGSWKILKFQTDADDTDGFDPSGLMILRKERTWLQQGQKIGDHLVPLTRNFDGMHSDTESGSNSKDKNGGEIKEATNLVKSNVRGASSSPLKNEVNKYGGSREAISNKYATIREKIRQASKMRPTENIASTKVSLLEAANSQTENTEELRSSGLVSTWASVKSRFKSFKDKVEAKKLLPLTHLKDSKILSCGSSSESLDEIFKRLRQPGLEQGNYSDGDEDRREIGS